MSGYTQSEVVGQTIGKIYSQSALAIYTHL